VSRRARLLAVIAAAAVVLIELVLGVIFVRVHGWGDWAIGTNTAYCGVSWPHLDFCCQSGR